jgi:hypothetical protein
MTRLEELQAEIKATEKLIELEQTLAALRRAAVPVQPTFPVYPNWSTYPQWKPTITC